MKSQATQIHISIIPNYAFRVDVVADGWRRIGVGFAGTYSAAYDLGETLAAQYEQRRTTCAYLGIDTFATEVAKAMTVAI